MTFQQISYQYIKSKTPTGMWEVKEGSGKSWLFPSESLAHEFITLMERDLYERQA